MGRGAECMADQQHVEARRIWRRHFLYVCGRSQPPVRNDEVLRECARAPCLDAQMSRAPRMGVAMVILMSYGMYCDGRAEIMSAGSWGQSCLPAARNGRVWLSVKP